MKRRDYKNCLLSAFLSGCLLMPGAIVAVNAQNSSEIKREEQKSVRDDNYVEREAVGKVVLKMGRNDFIKVDNRSTGRITVIGWNNDYIEAVATSERGQEAIRYRTWTDNSGATWVWLKADYAGLETERSESKTPEDEQPRPKPQPTPAPTPTATPEAKPSPQAKSPPGFLGLSLPRFSLSVQNPPPLSANEQPVQIHLEVRVPRYAGLQPLRVWRSPVEIKGIDKGVAVRGERSDILIDDVGAADVRNGSGNVEVSNSGGLISVVTASGMIRVKNAVGDVRALSISGAVEIRCARGHVAVNNTDGPITLSGLSGNVVDASSTNGNIIFTGTLHDGGLYLLKSMAGNVEMRTSAGAGFTATLSSYRGGIETDYDLKTNQAQHSPTAARLVGSFGSGRAQITLDSFDGAVKLKKAAPSEITDCK